MIFFLHFLVVASALLGLPRSDEDRHRLEYFVHPPHMLIQEVVVVNFQEPMIPLVLLKSPVPEFLVRIGYLMSFSASGLGSVTW